MAKTEILVQSELMPKSYGKCAICGSNVSGYTANEPLHAIRPESKGSDWWAACDNVDCEHHYGEDMGWFAPGWAIQD